MTPIKTKHTTFILGAPSNWDAEANGPCHGLPVLVEGDGGMRRFYSYWKVTWRERLAILCGRTVRLVVNGATHPPVHLDTELH